MNRFICENFYLLESLAGLIPIGCIAIHCILEVRKSKAASENLTAAIEDSHRQLKAERLNREEVSKAMDIIRRRLRKD